MVGRNGLFYDRQGRDWDATITKIVDNPISIRQAFWSPYKKFVRLIEEQVAKRAAVADAESHRHLSDRRHRDRRTSVTTKPPESQEDRRRHGRGPGRRGGRHRRVLHGDRSATPPASSELGLLADGAGDPRRSSCLISLPSVMLAYIKLRKRNLGPILDANGWAVNAPRQDQRAVRRDSDERRPAAPGLAARDRRPVRARRASPGRRRCWRCCWSTSVTAGTTARWTGCFPRARVRPRSSAPGRRPTRSRRRHLRPPPRPKGTERETRRRVRRLRASHNSCVTDQDMISIGLSAAASAELLVASIEDYAISSSTRTGTSRSWNPGAERIKGYSRRGDYREAVLASSTRRRIGRPASRREPAGAVPTGVTRREGWRVRKDGSRFWAPSRSRRSAIARGPSSGTPRSRAT